METKEEERKSHIGIVNFERRTHPRFNIDLPIEYQLLHSSTIHEGRALNASEGGLLVYFSEKIDIGQLLKVKLFFAMGSKLNSIEMVMEVVWQDLHLGKDWGDYRTGMKFVDIPPESLNQLKNFLRSLSE
jgi:c-di-GMP-binding flagellar brake protein YcgR